MVVTFKICQPPVLNTQPQDVLMPLFIHCIRFGCPFQNKTRVLANISFLQKVLSLPDFFRLKMCRYDLLIICYFAWYSFLLLRLGHMDNY
jgi:hypothetical protein